MPIFNKAITVIWLKMVVLSELPGKQSGIVLDGHCTLLTPESSHHVLNAGRGGFALGVWLLTADTLAFHR